jgi:hypothetical protein
MLSGRRGTIISKILLHNGIIFILGSVKRYMTSAATKMKLELLLPKRPCWGYDAPTPKAASWLVVDAVTKPDVA